jgi:hypothetical protein
MKRHTILIGLAIALLLGAGAFYWYRHQQAAQEVPLADRGGPPDLSQFQNQRQRKAKPPIVDPQARTALAKVGADAASTAYWTKAINNASLPAEERKDLIEDLNQDGFANRRNLTKDDLPLIEARLLLIEELAPKAMDTVNAEAFKEAKKDLIKMRSRLGR